jgi:hypothetical protein
MSANQEVFKMNHELINVMHNGVRVKGVVTQRTHSDINVEITHPYSGLTTGRHIPYWCCPYISFLGDYGDKRTRELLIELYEKGHVRIQ